MNLDEEKDTAELLKIEWPSELKSGIWLGVPRGLDLIPRGTHPAGVVW